MDIYKEITDRIIEQLENGVIPWQKPWTGLSCGAVSHSTGRPYSVLNQCMLADGGEYITFNQCKAEGGKVKKGAKGKFVVFWKILQTSAKDGDGSPVFGPDGMPEVDTIPVLRHYHVFNVETDCEGIERRWTVDNLPKGAEAVEKAENVLQGYLNRSGVKLTNEKGDRAFYRPSTDSITLPLMEQFADTAEYYSTAFHECVHSTGHASRLNRLTTGIAAAFGGEDYSKEELVAEIGSATIMHEMGMETKKSFKNSAAYIQSWLQALRNDKRLIVSAAGKAEKAAKMILDIE